MAVRNTVFGEFATRQAMRPQQRLKHAHQFKDTGGKMSSGDMTNAMYVQSVAPLNLPAAVKRSRRRLADDAYRPLYHYAAPANLLKDPNGPLYWQGRYHLFYQNNPYDVEDSNMHWGHTVSEDLLHWTDLPVAISPTPGGPDRDGCWSGPIVIVDGIPTAVYYGNPAGICIARSHPADTSLIHWVKFEGNPIIPPPPAGSPWKPFDPCVWKYGNLWHLICGGRSERGDTAFLLTSTDFIHWEYQHEFYEGTRSWTEVDEDCAVPDFFSIGDKHMLIFSSHKHGAQYYLGTYSPSEKKFHPEQHSRLNHNPTIGVTMESGNYIAPATLEAPDGRRILFSWIGEGRRFSVQQAAGWCGIMAIPRVLSLTDGGVMRIEPIAEIDKLRRRYRRVSEIVISPDEEIELDGIGNDVLEIGAEIEPRTARECGLAIRYSADGAEQTLVSYAVSERQIKIDVSRSSQNPDVVDLEEQAAPLELARDEPLRLRIFLDRSVIEVFANDRQCLTKRIYPSQFDSVEVAVYARGGTAKLISLDAWDMTPVWPSD